MVDIDPSVAKGLEQQQVGPTALAAMGVHKPPGEAAHPKARHPDSFGHGLGEPGVQGPTAIESEYYKM